MDVKGVDHNFCSADVNSRDNTQDWSNRLKTWVWMVAKRRWMITNSDYHPGYAYKNVGAIFRSANINDRTRNARNSYRLKTYILNWCERRWVNHKFRWVNRISWIPFSLCKHGNSSTFFFSCCPRPRFRERKKIISSCVLYIYKNHIAVNPHPPDRNQQGITEHRTHIT